MDKPTPIQHHGQQLLNQRQQAECGFLERGAFLFWDGVLLDKWLSTEVQDSRAVRTMAWHQTWTLLFERTDSICSALNSK